MKYVLPIIALIAFGLHAADLSGNWPGVLQTGRGVDDHNLTLRLNGQALTGSVAFSNGKWDIRNVKLDGQKLTFEIALQGSSSWVLGYELNVAGDEMTGTVKALSGSFPGGKVQFKRKK